MLCEVTAFDAATKEARDVVRRVSWRRHPWLMANALFRRQPALERSAPPTSRAEILERLRELPNGLWSYGWEPAETRHLGPMAQDFFATFGLGTSDRRIDLGDANAVSMAAICALADRVDELEARLAALGKHERAEDRVPVGGTSTSTSRSAPDQTTVHAGANDR